MKTTFRTILAVLLTTALPGRADQTIDDNLTVNQNLTILQDVSLFGPATFGRLLENPAMEGFRISLEQDSATSTVDNVITPGYWGTDTVVVEDYGWLDGYEAPVYEWVTIDDYHPATYDEDGNLVQEEWWDSHDEYQQVGSVWVWDSSIWGVTGTHTENVDVWVPEETETVEITNYGAPRVLFTATRSDTNWVFRAPATANGQMRDALTIYNGGLLMNSENGQASYSVNPSQSLQSLSQPGINYSAKRSADATEHKSQASWQSGGVNHSALAENTSRPELIRLSRTEFVGTQTTATQTQIAAVSAQFGGVVTVEGEANIKGALIAEGDANVKGVLRVMPRGDLSMGGFHKGARPDGTVDPGA